MKAIALALIAIVSITLLMHRAVVADKVQANFAQCIENQARAAHYAGNVFGPEAWDTFASLCN